MDTFILRAQTGFGKFSTAASAGAIFVAILSIAQLWLSGAFHIQSSIANVEPKMRWHDSWRFGATHNTRKENARFTFDLDADLTPLFNWNTKQVFAYVTVDYNTTSKRTGTENSNSVVIWDKILQTKDKANLTLKNERSKYSVYDIQQVFGGSDRSVEINLRWNVQPHVGLLLNGATKVSADRVELPPLPQKKEQASA